ncbi:adenosylcobinamide-GDP ribazoletransferase [Maritimibacter sp. DP1N21-5]|uniref:adenosylcobinamide-GDP ribazoletransferase n=1 Tax=Maritimibacter sp. DP1N21-5 TaxID=2836867 RepID=UPI001C46DF82|nr:adenosylcobinamide-GDP ribazoletransferase [Maritimibacter sp. DP1N21-5]MBV7410181.1 adenosylcobinamide-GDP ribazoletransferase [Maritimibacter sp. DP1N21-5]
MSRSKGEVLTRPGDLLTALALLTRLPIRADFTRGARAAWAYPLAGLAPTLIGAAVVALAGLLGLAAGAAAGLGLVAFVLSTGALHEDGLADCADGFWGGHDRARRLAIMKDSRIGSYGTIALVLSLLLRWYLLTGIVAQGDWLAPILATAVLSRAPMVVLMAALPNARGSGLSASTGVPPRETAILAVVLAVLAALVLTGAAALAPIFWTTLAAVAVAAIARAKIGGQTGDVLGATQQLCEIAALAAFSAL